MDETLLADLVEYRKDKDKAVVASARSLLQLFRTKVCREREINRQIDRYI